MTLYGHRNHRRPSLVEQQCIGRWTCRYGNRCNVCKQWGGLSQFILDGPLTSTREYTQCHHNLPPLLAYAKKNQPVSHLSSNDDNNNNDNNSNNNNNNNNNNNYFFIVSFFYFFFANMVG